MHARSKTLLFSYNMHLFLPYLLNDSQTIHSMIHFSKPLLCVMLLCADWSISFKAVFVSAVLLCVQRYQGNSKSGNKWAGNMLMFDVDVKQGLVLKTTRFNDSESTLSFERR